MIFPANALKVLFLASWILALPTLGFADEGVARKLLNSQGCKACHTLEGDGGKLAPSFEEMRKNLSRSDIRLKLYNQSGRHGNARIQDFSHLSPEELDALVNFIKPQE